MSAFSRLRSRIADAYWERRSRPLPKIDPDRKTRLLARMDQALAANRDRMIVCDDPENCHPYGEHYRRLHGDGPS